MKLFQMLAASSVFLFACNEPDNADTATVGDEVEVLETEGNTYEIDTSASTLVFRGYGVGKSHPGEFQIKDGEIKMEDDRLTGGEIVVDIRSMKMHEEGDMITGKLQPHLQSADFFDAEKYPEAVFTLTHSEPYSASASDTSVVEGANYRVSGNLKLKDQTKNVTFPANIQISENSLTAKADFNIDRRDWDMKYGADKSLGDKFISETVNIKLDVKASAD